MNDLQKIDTISGGQVAQNVEGDMVQHNYNIIQSNRTREQILTSFCNIQAMWNIEIDYHFRLLYHYSTNSDYIHNFIVAITDFDIIYFSDIFQKKLKYFKLTKEEAIKRFRQLHKNLILEEHIDSFIRRQFETGFNDFFTNLPRDDWKRDDILSYGVHATIYFHFLRHKTETDIDNLLSVCSNVFSEIKNKNVYDKNLIIKLAINNT